MWILGLKGLIRSAACFSPFFVEAKLRECNELSKKRAIITLSAHDGAVTKISCHRAYALSGELKSQKVSWGLFSFCFL